MAMVDMDRSVRGLLVRAGRCAGLVGILVLAGCIPVPPDDGDGPGSPGPGQVTAAIVAPTLGFGISMADLPVAVRYTVTGEPDNIDGFYVRVADGNPGSPATSDRSALGMTI